MLGLTPTFCLQEKKDQTCILTLIKTVRNTLSGLFAIGVSMAGPKDEA